MRHQNFCNLGDSRGLSKEARRWNSSQSVWQWLTRARRVQLSLPHEPRIQKQTKKEYASNYFKTSGGKVQTKANTANTFRAILLRCCGCGLAHKRMWVWFRAQNYFILNVGMEKEQKQEIGMEGICITHSCIPLYTVYMQHIMAHSGGMQE